MKALSKSHTKRPPHVSGGLLFMNFLNLLTLPTWAPLHWKRSHWTQKGIAARRLLPTCAIPCFTSSAVGRGSFAVMKNAVRGPPESCTLRIFAFARIFGKRTTPNESQKGLIAKCDSPFVKRCEIRGWRFSGYPLSKRLCCQRQWRRVWPWIRP